MGNEKDIEKKWIMKKDIEKKCVKIKKYNECVMRSPKIKSITKIWVSLGLQYLFYFVPCFLNFFVFKIQIFVLFDS